MKKSVLFILLSICSASTYAEVKDRAGIPIKNGDAVYAQHADSVGLITEIFENSAEVSITSMKGKRLLRPFTKIYSFSELNKEVNEFIDIKKGDTVLVLNTDSIGVANRVFSDSTVEVRLKKLSGGRNAGPRMPMVYWSTGMIEPIAE